MTHPRIEARSLAWENFETMFAEYIEVDGVTVTDVTVLRGYGERVGRYVHVEYVEHDGGERP